MKTLRSLLALAALCTAAPLALTAAETVSTDTLTVTTQRRTWRIQIFTELGTDYRAEFLREEVKTLPDGTRLSRTDLPTVVRTVSAIQGASVALANGKTLTGAELAEALARFADKFAAEDATPSPPPPPAPSPSS